MQNNSKNNENNSICPKGLGKHQQLFTKAKKMKTKATRNEMIIRMSIKYPYAIPKPIEMKNSDQNAPAISSCRCL